jgi:arylsulfatase A-like enzyme
VKSSLQATTADRLFIYYALHNTHSPVEAPLRIQQLYTKFADWPKQQVFNAMVTAVDESTRNVTAALKRTGLWQNTLFVWSTGRWDCHKHVCVGGGGGGNLQAAPLPAYT